MLQSHSTSQVIVREAKPEDDVGVNRLFTLVFGFERSAEHFHWKTYANPDGPMVAVVATSGDQVVGYYGFWPTSMRLGGKLVRGGQALDIMLDPQHRGLPLALRLCSQCIELAAQRGMKLLYGLPNALALKLQVSKLNSDHVGDVPLWARVLSASENMNIAGPRGWAVRAMALLPSGQSSGYEVREAVPTLAELRAFLERVRLPHGRLRVAPMAERLLWRFDQHAGRHYRWFGAWVGDSLHGLVVLGDHTHAHHGMLSEMMGVADAPQVAALHEALAALKRDGKTLVHAMSTAGPRDTVLKACGFRRRRVAQPLVAHTPTVETLPANPHVFEDWVVFGADHDVY